MTPYLTEHFGNPSSSTHRYGWTAEAAVEDSRERVAAAIGASEPREVVFTSGTTESDNLALQGVMRAGNAGEHLITSVVEHPAVLDTARALEAEGFALSELPVDSDGLIDAEGVAAALNERTRLVSIGAANSEIGVLQPLAEIGAVCREHGVAFHSDAAQAVGKVPLDVQELRVDLLSFCAHKLYGPKGVGALYVREQRPRLRLVPMLHGGGHERGRRSGTLPVPLIVGFARAVELCLEDLEAEAARIGALRDRLWELLKRGLPDLRRSGHATRCLPGNLNVCFRGVEADALLVALKDVALSAGSACASATGDPSHVLLALGLSEREARASLRFGLGRGTTLEEIDRVALRVCEEAQALRARGAPAGHSGRLRG
jgi:cysteine desulfurase